MIAQYLGDEPLTLAEVKLQCRVDGDDEDGYFEGVLIPAARSLAEEVSGAAIRKGRYIEQASDVGNSVLARGCVIEVESVTVNGDSIPFAVTQTGRLTLVQASGCAGRAAQITYTAGIDIAVHAGVRAWMLLVVVWLYANRELMGQREGAKAPPHISAALLSSINVQPGF
ncbi:head-tail connector protein [Comamonas testosteroni]|uniref:Phage gp6-like head-tail connector protein n=1 Tax=Comamonas testosteroni TaxID=285 RepID=A0A8B4S108_COMTE|nr:head-tail connector protein [Comamonas testosteroni]EHN65107.1 hypothetical protein CTATCC11996_14938 [Comamonas testosteroni ATCC 11996]QQN69485.1 phage gp6-like head-tail connector protein [Comamonas testosteroni]SUY77109.1 Uncharacterised protein [Comamonas testosteroni]